jgi:hypothetical protein
VLDKAAHRSLENEWYEVFGNALDWHCRSISGVRAEAELLSQKTAVLFVVPFLRDSRSLPTSISTNVPRGAAYKCLGTVLPLAGFRFEDKFVAPPDFSWCMIYTHEDHTLTNGPLFFRREWIIPPRETGKGARRTRRYTNW